MPHVAIVGAGIAGLSCAETLRESGIAVTLFDKGRGPGGRLASRRIETSMGTAEFDFGAQYFTARDTRFSDRVSDWERAGVVARWPAACDGAYIGMPTMKAVVQHLCLHHTVHFSSLIKGIVRRGKHWYLVSEEARPETNGVAFDGIVLALPAEQTAPIMTLHDFELTLAALYARSQPCWAGMFIFSRPLEHRTGIVRDSGMITWAARNLAKPGRTGPEGWVVQADPRWSLERLERLPEIVGPQILAAFANEMDGKLPDVIGQSIHRWRYGLSAGTGTGCLWNNALRLGACGDWLLGPRIESAWLSGHMLAEQMVAQLPRAAQ